MIAKFRDLFSFPVTNSKHKNDGHYNFELVNCPLKEMICEAHHSSINKSFQESEKYLKERDYNSSIETLKSAFDRTVQLMEHPCTYCAHHFRSSIVESLENIHDELRKKSNNFFTKKYVKQSYIIADNTLKEFESKGIRPINHNNKNRFLGNHLN